MKKLLAPLLGMALLLCHSNTLFSQTTHLHVEVEGDHSAIIQSVKGTTGVGEVSLDLLRGDESTDGDWRFLNDNSGHLRVQNGTDNFMAGGTNRLSLLNDGLFGIGCTNPQAKLSICSGQMAFSNAFAESAADKISLDGYSFGQPFMVGLGYETSLFIGTGGTEEISDLYFKAEGAHRWYTNTNADLGLSASMVLNREGRLGIGTNTPEQELEVVGTMRVSSTALPALEIYDSSSDRKEGDLWSTGSDVQLISYFGDIDFRAGTTGALPSTHMTIDGPTGNVGIGTTAPDAKLHVNYNSSTGNPQVRLTETGTDVVRFEFRNTTNSHRYTYITSDPGAASPSMGLGFSGAGGNTPDRLLDLRFGDQEAILEGDLILKNPNNSTYTLRTSADGDLNLVGDGVVRFSIEDTNGDVGMGTTLPQADLHIVRTGDAELLLEADTGNSNENNQPKVKFRQDGGAVTGEVGYHSGTNDLRVINEFGGAAIILMSNGDIIIGKQ